MFFRDRVIQALEQEIDRFRGFQRVHGRDVEACRAALADIARWPAAHLMEVLSLIEHPGALPTLEHDHPGGPAVPFPHRWSNHQEARRWAMEVLAGRPTFAVDGSQILPPRAFSLPIALVQVAWFENPHRRGGAYEKDIHVEVIPPAALSSALPDEEGRGWEEFISLRRYQLEVERLVRYMEAHAGEDPPPVAFFDGSLIASFTARLSADVQSEYIAASLEMLSASERHGVPLIGYIDTSYARDLAEMVRSAGAACAEGPSDPMLLSPMMRWGDRTPAYISARDDKVLETYVDAERGIDFRRRIAFVYLKTTADNPPARLEFPLWLVEAGMLDDVLDVVRAEAIVGNGYPYPLETADATAVLSMEDRERFYALFQQFAAQHDLPLHISRKLISKRQRRV